LRKLLEKSSNPIELDRSYIAKSDIDLFFLKRPKKRLKKTGNPKRKPLKNAQS
jgi:hypothetical protein